MLTADKRTQEPLAPHDNEGRVTVTILKLRAVHPAASAFAMVLALTAFPMDMAPFGTTALAQGQRPSQVTVQNRTGTTLQNFFLVPLTFASWGEDLLGTDTVSPGSRTRVLPEGDRGQCRYDMRAVYAGGAEETRFDIDLCRTREIVLTPQSRESGSAAPPQRSGVAFYAVHNHTGMTIGELHVGRPGAPNQGREGNVLADSILDSGRSFTGRVARSSECLYDVRASGPDQTRQRINLCDVREIVFGERPAAGAAARLQTTTLTITNRNRSQIVAINVRQTGAANWGANHGEKTLTTGRRLALDVPRAAAQCAFDIRVTYDTGVEDVRANQNICETTDFAFAGPRR